MPLLKLISQVSLLLSVLVLAASVSSPRGPGEKNDAENKCESGERLMVDDALLDTVLCLLLDHFTYLQGTQGNQKKVRYMYVLNMHE